MKTEYYMIGNELQELTSWPINHKGIITRKMEIVGFINDTIRGEYICKILNAHVKKIEAKRLRLIMGMDK